MTALVEADRVSFALGSARLVDGVSVRAEPGDFVAVVGPNGAGKSTLLRLLAGDLSPTEGSVLIVGEPVTGTSLRRLALRRSFLSQHAATEVPFTVREVVMMGRYPYREDPENTPEADAAAVDVALAATDVAHLSGRVTATLSGGEEQRVSLARVLAQQAPVMLLDEPTTALDIGHQELVMRALRDAALRGAAVVCVVHDLNLAAVFADQVVLMRHGAAAAAGAPRAVFTEVALSEVYDHPIRVVDHPFREGPLVLPGEG
jgi:iron complex transport system ATP-binding protein